MEARQLWQAVVGEIEVTKGDAIYQTWFANTKAVDKQDDRIVIAVPNTYSKDQMERRYSDVIREILERIKIGIQNVEYTVDESLFKNQKGKGKGTKQPVEETPVSTDPPLRQASILPSMPSQNELPHQSAFRSSRKATTDQAPANTTLNSRYTLDTFVIGPSNEMAYAACHYVTKNPGGRYNPLFIYGGVGLGKTHLMQAVGNQLAATDPSIRVAYVTSEQFTNEFTNSIASKRSKSFAEKYRSFDVLIVDDIQFLGNKERTQEEFFHTFNHLHHLNKQVIMSSDVPPRDIPNLEDRLRSRFGSGMVADIQAPDLETRAAILQRKASSQGIEIPLATIEHLARHYQRNIRELEGALTQLIAWCEVRKCDPSIAAANQLLGDLAIKVDRRRAATPRVILEKTAAYFNVAVEDLKGPRRDKEVMRPRQVAMFLMKTELKLSFPKIAAAVGGRDHTTVMHSVKKVHKLAEVDEELRSDIAALKERLSL